MKWRVERRENLARFLSGKLSQSGKAVRRILAANSCLVNGKIERFGSVYVEKGDVLELAPQWKEFLQKKEIVFSVIYEDGDLKIVEKPAGWVCQGEDLVHRLDKETTGLLLLAKNSEAKEELMQLFARREVDKEYHAIVDGIPKEESGVRESLLARKKSYQGQVIWGSSSRGVKAITKWRIVTRGRFASLVQCHPLTGRTHQIRVHMAEMGHPILGDRQYAASFQSQIFVSRPLLHASRLEFSFRGKRISATSPLPQDMSQVLESIQR